MNYWLIENDKDSARVGDRLNNLQIQQIAPGEYQLVGVGVMSTSTVEPYVFENVPWQDHTWDIFLPHDLAVGENSKGHWHKHRDETTDTDPRDGDYTAQAGSGLGEEPGTSASSAKA